MPGGDDGLEYCYNCGADLHPIDASLPEIDFDANPNEQQCQNCLRLWVNDTEFAYKVCPDCRSKSRWAHWDEVEAAEALNPEPEHTRYEESIASANYSQMEAATEAPAPVEEKFTCFKRGCTVEVDERDLFCDDHALELSMIRSDCLGTDMQPALPDWFYPLLDIIAYAVPFLGPVGVCWLLYNIVIKR
jgi:hypothetical protein